MSQHYTGLTDLAEVLSDQGLKGLENAVALLINEAMKIERERAKRCMNLSAHTASIRETIPTFLLVWYAHDARFFY